MRVVNFLTMLLILCAFIAPRESNAQVKSVMEEMPWAVFIPCADNGNGEMAYGVLNLHTVIGNAVSHFQPAGGELIGDVTGDVYHPTGMTSNFFIETENGQLIYTYVNLFHMVGPGIQFFVRQVIHEIYVGGVWVTVVEKSETICK